MADERDRIAAESVIFTHDLDFGAIVAMTRASGPSVFQVRVQAVLPSDIGVRVVAALRACELDLAAGAIVTLDSEGTRVRVLRFEASDRESGPH